jgi:hypothetical protein
MFSTTRSLSCDPRYDLAFDDQGGSAHVDIVYMGAGAGCTGPLERRVRGASTRLSQ